MSFIAEELREFSFQGKRIPDYMHEAIINYVDKGRLPGDFLRAIICNDLKSSVHRADSKNIELIHVYVCFFYNYAPAACQGSEEAMLAWNEGFNTGEPNEKESFCSSAY